MSTPTQVKYPSRATLRTVVQSAAGALVMLATTIVATREELAAAGVTLPPKLAAILAVAAAVSTAVAGVVARIMAAPGIDARLGVLSASPRRTGAR